MLSPETIFTYMQQAVESAQTSLHPESKVGACLIGETDDSQAEPFWHVTKPNAYPPKVLETFGHQCRIGNASGTIHAETLCIVSTPKKTQNTMMFSTDPSCPNCTKNMAQAGITYLYIDHKGFEKYYAKKRIIDFETITMEIARKTGMGVAKVFRKEERIETLCDANNVRHQEYLKKIETGKPSDHYAACKDQSGKAIHVGTYEMLSLKPDHKTKYSLTVQPLTNLLMCLARHGIKPDPLSFVSSRLPTSRELVNFIGAGYKHLNIENLNNFRDKESTDALKTLTSHNILTTNT